MLLVSRRVLLLLLLVPAFAAAQDCADGCPVVSEPVLGVDGLTYMNSCFAACQGIGLQVPAVAAAAADEQAIVGPSKDAFAAAAAAAPVGVLIPRDTLAAREQQGMRMVGVLTAAAFQPQLPALTLERLQQMRSKRGLSAGRGTTMVVTSQGHLYAAPPAPTGPINAPPGVRLAAAPPMSGAQEASAAVAGAAVANEASSSSSSNGAATDDAAAAVAAGAAAVGGRRRLLSSERQQHLRSLHGSSSSSSLLWSLGRRPLGIIGKDSRKEIKGSPKFPFSAIGHILFDSADDGRKYQCTGGIVGPFAVLTAAHCIVGRNGQFQGNWRFTPGQTATGATAVGTADGVEFFFDSRYLGDDWVDYDVGLGIVNKAVGASSLLDYNINMAAAGRVGIDIGGSNPNSVPAGSGGISSKPSTDTNQLPDMLMPQKYDVDAVPVLRKTKLISAGYPSDKPFRSVWQISCTVTDNKDASDPVLATRCPVTLGQSGSPLLQQRTDKSGAARFIVRAVTSHEMCASVCGTTCCPGLTLYNGAVKITKNWKKWILLHSDIKPPRPVPLGPQMSPPPPSASPSPSAPPESPAPGTPSTPPPDGGSSPLPSVSPDPDVPTPPADDNNTLTPGPAPTTP